MSAKWSPQRASLRVHALLMDGAMWLAVLRRQFAAWSPLRQTAFGLFAIGIDCVLAYVFCWRPIAVPISSRPPMMNVRTVTADRSGRYEIDLEDDGDTRNASDELALLHVTSLRVSSPDDDRILNEFALPGRGPVIDSSAIGPPRRRLGWVTLTAGRSYLITCLLETPTRIPFRNGPNLRMVLTDRREVDGRAATEVPDWAGKAADAFALGVLLFGIDAFCGRRERRVSAS